MAKPLVNTFLVGSQKCATTWIYKVFDEHPEICVPKVDEVHFFDINYYKGYDYYRSFYETFNNQDVVVDTTSSYIRDERVPERIHRYNPQAKIIMSLRNPIDRAFSHYWHEKKKGKINFKFEEAIEYSGVGNYDLFNDWIVPGFYYQHIERFLEFFPKEKMLFLIYDDLTVDPTAYVNTMFKFLEVDPTFKPSILFKRINKANRGNIRRTKDSSMIRLYEELANVLFRKVIKPYLNIKAPKIRKTEYEIGMRYATRFKLRKIYSVENTKLGEFLSVDLSHWK